MSPAVSVVIPVYNPGTWLLPCLHSVLDQTMTDLEVVVVDDGSTQDLSWVDQIPDPRVRMLRQPNRGVSAARNAGVSAAAGDWVAFLDQDDRWDADKLALQWPGMSESSDAAFHYTGFVWVRDGRREPADHCAVSYQGLLADQHVCLSSVVVARTAYLAIGGHDVLLSQMQDWDLLLRLALARPHPVLTPRHLVDYHIHDANASHDYATAAAERLGVLDRHAVAARRRGDHETLAAARAGRRRTQELFAAKALDAARACSRAGDLAGVGRHLTVVARLDPGSLAQAGLRWVGPRATGRRRANSGPALR